MRKLPDHSPAADECDLSYQRPARQYGSRFQVKVIEFEEVLEKQLLDDDSSIS